MQLDRVIAVRTDKTVYRTGNKVIKVFNENFSKAEVLNEALNNARVEETSLSVPKILCVTVNDGKWCIVSEYIKGKTLSALMSESPEKEDEYMDIFASLHRKVHSERVHMLGDLRDKLNRKISEAPIGETEKYELHTRLNGMQPYKSVCHGDFNPSNIILAGDGNYYIIDWAHVTQGNPAADAAITYLLFCMDGKFSLAEKYLFLYSSKADIPRQTIKSWIPIVAAARLNDVKGGKELLNRWINVVDYE